MFFKKNPLLLNSDQKYRGRLEDIIFCGWPERDFNPVVDLQAFPRIKSLTIEYSRMAHIIDFPEMFHLQVDSLFR